MTTKRVLIAATTLLIVVPVFGATRERARGVRPGIGAPVQVAGSLVSVPVSIDLTGVKVGEEAATLGGFVVRVEFDRKSVEFVRADGGAALEFRTAPAATNAEKANATGVVRLASALAGPYGPSGRVAVASVVFREIAPDGAKSVKVIVESAASPIHEGADAQALTLPVDGQ